MTIDTSLQRLRQNINQEFEPTKDTSYFVLTVEVWGDFVRILDNIDCVVTTGLSMKRTACTYDGDHIHAGVKRGGSNVNGQTMGMNITAGARLTKAYDSQFRDIVNQVQKVKCISCVVLWGGAKFYTKFERAPLKIRTKLWSYTPKNMRFTRYLKFGDSWYLKVMAS